MDTMRQLCIQQGYVPVNCKLPGKMIYLLVQEQGDPCHGCEIDRTECGGRPEDEK